MNDHQTGQSDAYEAPSFDEVPLTGGLVETAPGGPPISTGY
jgi:hypothetical protein